LFAEFVSILLQFLAGVKRFDVSGVCCRFSGQTLEVISQIGVFLRDDPVLDVGFDGELDDRPPAGRALGCSGQKSVGCGEDGLALGVGFGVWPGTGGRSHRMVVISRGDGGG
jgi:hypothetical protein